MKKSALIGLLLIMTGVTTSLISQEISGKDLFRTNCKACHALDQNMVGPALMGVTQRRDSVWLHNFIKNSQAMIEAGDSIGVALFSRYNQVIMPPQDLTDKEINSILSYIENAEMESNAKEGLIERPIESYGTVRAQLGFDNYFFWIIFTITVLAVIFTFVYFTVLNDRIMEARGEDTVPQDQL